MFAVEPDQRKSSTYYLVTESMYLISSGEFLKILIFSERTEEKKLSWKMTLGHYSYLIVLQVFQRLHIY